MNISTVSAQLISKKSLFQYGFIALPIAFAGFPLYVLVPDFYATRYGLSLSLLGALFLGIRLFDAIQDPLIGWLIDKFQNNFLKFIICAACLLCVAILCLFNGVFFNPTVWLILCMMLAVSSYSVLTIILGAQATLWTADKSDQVRIASVREFFGLIGLLIAVSAPSVLGYIIDSSDVYLWYAILLTLLMTFAVIGYSNLPQTVNTQIQQRSSPLLGLRVLAKETKYFLIIYGFSMLASSIPAVLVIFFVRDLLGAEYLTGLFLLLYFLSGAAGMPLWKAISNWLGKYKAWALSHILAVSAFIGAFFLSNGDVTSYALVCVLSGISLGADLTLPPSILADHVHKHKNTAYSGIHYAFLAFIGKASLAVASAIVFPVLDTVGFKPQSINTEDALFVLSASYALIPCFIKILSAILLYYLFIRSQSGGHHDTLQNNSNYRNSHHA